MGSKLNARNSNQSQKPSDEKQMSQSGKSYEEMLPYLLSGEPDDLSTDFTDKLK